MANRHSISLVMPFYNEIDYIKMTISKAKTILESIKADFEIILVDDASHDGSEEIADILASEDPRIKVFHHQKNSGLGASLKTGYKKSRKDIIVYSDLDLPFDFALLNKNLKLMDNADIVHGYRIGRRESPLRSLYSIVYNLLIRIIFGYKPKDINFSMTIFKRSILQKISLKADGSFISAEFMLKSHFNNFKILEVPATFNHRKFGRSQLSSFKHIVIILCELIKYYPEIRSLRH